MWFAIGMFLVVMWVIAKIVIGVASAAIHLALLAGILFVIVHFARRVKSEMGKRPGTATGSV